MLAASSKGGLLHAPDLYMEKLVVGPSSKDAVSLDAPVDENLKAIARCLEREVEDLVVVVLDRPRHEKLIADIRATGARIRLIGDGDLSAGIAAAVVGTGVHAVMGTGGAPEGVLTAAAMRCLNGEIFARLVVKQAGGRGALPRDGDHRSARRSTRSKDLALGRRHHLRRDRRHRRHADARRPLLRRRHAHQLDRHAERPAAHPLHRHHPRRADRRQIGSERHPILSVCASTGAAISSRSRAASFIGFMGFTLVMPFLPLYLQQLGRRPTSGESRCGPG